ncbi:MAG TPA: ISL3 family transposase [Chthonomonadaceae bacterium]|nr:ISL3 family transposase [Chthonomonadaceae bacterium]
MASLFLLPPGYRLLERPNARQSPAQPLGLALLCSSARCPVCHRPSRRVHSRYWRTLADLPCSGQKIVLHVRMRRFFCGNRHCPRRTFAETLPGLAAKRARRTQRMQQALTRLGQAVGSRPGVRLAISLALPTSATTLLRLERAAPVPVVETPRVLGVDDWAFKKGRRYGTILYDLEKHRPVDLLPDATADSLAAWLQQHPGGEIISRDRGGCYAEGARKGAPHAIQVADRWHLAKNLGEALERLLDTKRSLLKQAAGRSAEAENAAAAPQEAPTTSNERQSSRSQQRLQQEKACRRQYRLERYETVQALLAQGMNLSAIGRHLRLNRRTVRKLAQAEVFPERKQRASRPSKLNAYKAFLLQPWQEGCHNAAALLTEITA